MEKDCPEERCWHWIPAGGYADMSGKVYKTLEEGFKAGNFKHFPYGGCSCPLGKCIRLTKMAKMIFMSQCHDIPSISRRV